MDGYRAVLCDTGYEEKTDRGRMNHAILSFLYQNIYSILSLNIRVYNSWAFSHQELYKNYPGTHLLHSYFQAFQLGLSYTQGILVLSAN